MNSLKKGEQVPLLNFVGGPGIPLLNFRGVPGPTFKLWGGSRVSGYQGPGSRGPGPTFTPYPVPGLAIKHLTLLVKTFDESLLISFKSLDY